jgi:cytochrome c
MKIVAMGLALAGVVAATPLYAANDAAALATAKHCFVCHNSRSPDYGPSFEKIARKWKNMGNADVMLADRIENGGVAHWGANAMPPSPVRGKVTKAEAQQLAKWVLTQY